MANLRLLRNVAHDLLTPEALIRNQALLEKDHDEHLFTCIKLPLPCMKMLRPILTFLLFTAWHATAAPSVANDPIRILLIGDSTTEGSIPRLTNPDGPHLEVMIRQLLAMEPGMPALKVHNLGQGGDTAFRLLDSGRYEKEISVFEKADYIFVRYGINDWSKRQPVEQNFPNDLRAVIQRLKTDFENARIIPTTIIPYLNEEQSKIINRMIHEVSIQEGLDVFDIYPLYAKHLLNGPNSLNYRRYPVKDIPEKHRQWITPRVYDDKLVVMDNEYDAIFGDLPGWYSDRHPNLAGYNVIAVETAKYLIPLLRQRTP
jgi:lysophospholipase L1-like esterase